MQYVNSATRHPVACRYRRIKVGARPPRRRRYRRRVPNQSGECPQSRSATDHDLFSAGTGTPAIFTLKEPRLVRVQKYTVFQSPPPNATLAVLPKPCTTRPSFLPVESRM